MSDIKSLIEQRRRQMLVHSCIYYRHDKSIVSDQQFDKWAKELVELQALFPELAKECVYAEYFDDWDGTTGYHLPTWLPEVERKARQLIEQETH